MNFREKTILGLDCLKAVFLHRRKPLFVSWELTRRCNLRCRYCAIWDKETPELGTSQVLAIVEDLFARGMRVIRFTGGEPLLREDIGIIINCCKKLGIATYISTNGFLLTERIDEIKNLDGITVSLDGPEHIHDSIRGVGTYKKTMEALEISKRKNIPISIATTLNSSNLSSVEYLVEIADKLRVSILFQPAIETILGDDKPNPVSPDIDRYKKVILLLLGMKRRSRFIGNSIAGLRYLYNWPNRTSINCLAGKVICRLDSEGNLNPCSRFMIKNDRLNLNKERIEFCFKRLPTPNCGTCWCSSVVELNLALGFNIGALVNIIKFS